jgi:hypothetical protein
MTTAKKTTKKAAVAKPAMADPVVPVEDVELPDPGESTQSEKLAAEAAPAKRPKGAPALRGYLQLARREKAQLLRALEKLSTVASSTEAKLEKASPTDTTSANSFVMSMVADTLDLAADVEDALTVAAVDREAFAVWAASAPDEDLMALMGWYSQELQLGDPEASPN